MIIEFLLNVIDDNNNYNTDKKKGILQVFILINNCKKFAYGKLKITKTENYLNLKLC